MTCKLASGKVWEARHRKISKFWAEHFKCDNGLIPVGLINQGCLKNSVKTFKIIFKPSQIGGLFNIAVVVFHTFIPLNIRGFWHFNFEYRGSTSLLFTNDLVSYSCVISFVINCLSNMFMFMFTTRPKHYAQSIIIIHTLEMDKFRIIV